MTSEAFLLIRKSLKLTQQELAKRLGVEANTVARWERGERPILTITELAMSHLADSSMNLGSGYRAKIDDLRLLVRMEPEGKTVSIFQGRQKLDVPKRPEFSFESGLEPNLGLFQRFAVEHAYRILGRRGRPTSEDVLSVDWEKY